MGTYIVLSKRTAEGAKALRNQPEGMQEIRAAVTALDGKVVAQYATLGELDFCTIISLPDNSAAHLLAGQTPAGRERTILPAIDLPLFVRLLGQTTETVGPYRWQTSWWARLVRWPLWWWEQGRMGKRYMKPYTVLGRENLKGIKPPAIIIANHTSHMDGPALTYALPWRFRDKTAGAAAADRWFLKGMKGLRRQPWWGTLLGGSFPMKRGGGRAALGYAEWLIDKGFSIIIFPEGTRSRSGKLGRFRHGPAILAVTKQVPVIPLYMEGLGAIRAVGSKEVKPGPVTVIIGKPVRFAPGTDINEATHTLYKTVDALRQQVHRHHAAAEPPAAAAAAD